VKRWLLTAPVVLLVPLLVRGQAPDEKKLDEIVSKALKTFEAPGLAIVIVKGDQVVYRKGQ
jgi:CubicO group peptidase (beta-lactamase class C family)